MISNLIKGFALAGLLSCIEGCDKPAMLERTSTDTRTPVKITLYDNVRMGEMDRYVLEVRDIKTGRVVAYMSAVKEGTTVEFFSSEKYNLK